MLTIDAGDPSEAAPIENRSTRFDIRLPNRHQLGLLLLFLVPSLLLATLVVWWLQDVMGVPNPSSVYLVVVVVCALASGTAGAIAAAVGSFIAYDFLFVEPRLTLTISDPAEYIALVLLLFVGVVVGQLAALQRSRMEIARAREREARALFQLSRALATRVSTTDVLPELVEILRDEAGMDRAWIAIGTDEATDTVVADSSSDPRHAQSGRAFVLRRMPGDEPARWIRVQQPARRTASESTTHAYQVRVEASGVRLAAIWGLRDRRLGPPDRTETRLLAAAADQVGQALAKDKLAAESQAAELARQSDELKSALLQSVSHDLRTPLATIRAAAGSLRPTSGLSEAERNQNVDAIDREVEYLNRMVTNLLDLSRIEAGALRAERDAFELDDLIGQSLERLRSRLGDRLVEVELDVPPVLVDPIYLDSSFTNIIENVIKYTPPGTRLRISARQLSEGAIRLTVEDAGPGVPDESLTRLFDKFYRAPGTKRVSRSGTGIGLAVVRGLTEAMGGSVHARHAEIGGLAIDMDLPTAAGAEPAAHEVPAAVGA